MNKEEYLEAGRLIVIASNAMDKLATMNLKKKRKILKHSIFTTGLIFDIEDDYWNNVDNPSLDEFYGRI